MRFGSLIHAYCLMNNHYHLFVETPHGDLSRVIHLINTSYSVYFNKKWDRCGHPFQGRFKAILVQAEHYAREIVPYIHLNPVRAGLTKDPAEYTWSNYREYLGLMGSRPWTRTSLVLSCFGSKTEDAQRRYSEYVNWRLGQKQSHPLQPAKSTGILGDPRFIDGVRRTFLRPESSVPERELPQLRRPKVKPELARIVTAAELTLGKKNRLAKRVAIFVSHKNTDYSLKELSEFFHMSISAVSEAFRYSRSALRFNQSLIQAVADIEKQVFG